MFTLPLVPQLSYANAGGLMHSAFFASPFDLSHGQLSFVHSDFVFALAPFKYSRDEIACLPACRIASPEARRPIPSPYGPNLVPSTNPCLVGYVACIIEIVAASYPLAHFTTLRFVTCSYMDAH